MRRPELVLLLVCVVLLATGCSRLTFIKPSSKRVAFEETAPTYSVSDSPATKQRLAGQDRLALASQRFQAGDFVAAEREVNAALKINPASDTAHTLLALIQDRQGNTQKAGTHYKRAAELVPAQGVALNNYGAWLCSNGYPAESLVWFDRAIAAPGYATPASALANAGGCALKVGQYERAGRDLRQALALDPANAYALASMAQSEYQHARYFEARAFSERRLAVAPASAETLQLASEIEAKLGDKAAANRYIQQLRAEFPETANGKPGDAARP